jgi:hypothetical protein
MLSPSGFATIHRPSQTRILVTAQKLCYGQRVPSKLALTKMSPRMNLPIDKAVGTPPRHSTLSTAPFLIRYANPSGINDSVPTGSYDSKTDTMNQVEAVFATAPGSYITAARADPTSDEPTER